MPNVKIYNAIGKRNHNKYLLIIIIIIEFHIQTKEKKKKKKKKEELDYVFFRRTHKGEGIEF